MRKVLSIFAVIVLLVSCMPERQNKHLTYQNIVILSDMSSRLNNRPPKDTAKIREIVEYFRNECVKPGEKIGDKSSITFLALSEKVAASIDIDKIKDLGDKQSFINSTGKYSNCGLEQEIKNFEKAVKNVYGSIRNPGLDLISVLIEKIENENIIKHNNLIINGLDTNFISYENRVYIFTDGYLEYKNARANRQFYFGSSEINRVRRYCVGKRMGIERALEQNRSLCLPPCKSKKNQHIHLHILETHERDKNVVLQTYNNPTGLRDNEILEAVWRKWAKESGFKSFEWAKY